MAEEQGRAGDKGEERIIALLEGLGWKRRGDTNIDIKCDYKYHSDRGNTYGIDGYMTYEGPYRDKERGFIIESKNIKWENYGPKDIKRWTNSTLEKVFRRMHLYKNAEIMDITSNLPNSITIILTSLKKSKF